MADHIKVPSGMTALRVQLDGAHYDVAVENDVARLIVEKHGEELKTDEGLAVAQLSQILSVNDSSGCIGRVFSVLERLRSDIDGSFKKVPHLRKFEYIDRQSLDLGPRPRPKASPGSTGRPKTRNPVVTKRRKKNKEAKRARKRNRNR